jgi:hypothetical protein
MRGDLDGAMGLYQQVLDNYEGLGDLQGKSATLGMMGQMLWKFKHYAQGLMALLDSMEISRKMGARPDVERAASVVLDMCNDIGTEKFYPLWKEITGRNIPNWLSQPSQQ